MHKGIIDARKLEYNAIILLLFFASMNFGAKFFYFAYGTLLVTLLINRKVFFHLSMVPYLLIGAVMSIYYIPNGTLAMIRPFAFFAVYFVVYNIGINTVNNTETESLRKTIQQKISVIIVSVCLGSFFHLMLNFFTNFGSVNRNTIDIWSNEILSATCQAMLGCLMVGLSIKMIICPEKKWERYFGIFAAVLMLSYNLILSGRTMIALYLVLFLCGYIYYFRKMPNKSKVIKLTIWIIAIILAFMFLYSINAFDIRKTITSSNLYSRFFEMNFADVINTDRGEAKRSYILNMLSYPLGGSHLREKFGYAHDLLLDAYDEFGFISFVLIIIILVYGIKEFFFFLKRTEYEFPFKLAVSLVYFSILIQFTLEPILVAAQWLFACYCLFNACLLVLNYVDKQCKKLTPIDSEQSIIEN